jgi:HEAT repeat protein
MESVRQIETLVRETRAKPALKKDIEAALIAVLSGKSTFEGKRFACQYLAAIGTEKSLPALAGLLKDKETVGIACLALGSYSSAKANDVLRDALPALQGVARAQVIDTLGDRRDAASVKLLADLTRDPDALVAQSAITALAKIGNEPARRIIGAMRHEKKTPFMAVVTTASFRIADHLAAANDRKGALAIYDEFCHPSQPVHIRRAALAGMLRLDRDGGERRILDVLRSPDAVLKPAAIAGVPALKSPRASETFAATMPKLQPDLQVLMIGALASRGDAPARRAISAETQNPDANVALAAIQALGTIGDAACVPVLIGVVEKRASAECVAAALASLQQLQDKAASDAILAAAKQASPDVRASLIDVLVGRCAVNAVPFLLEQAAQGDGKVAVAAFRGLGRLAEPPQLDALVGLLMNLRQPALEKDAAAAIIQVSRKIADPAKQSDAVLAACPKAQSVPQRCALLLVLGQTAGPKALEVVITSMKNSDENIRDAAIRALANWPDPAADRLLLEQARVAKNPTHQVLLLRGYIRLLGLPANRTDEQKARGYHDALALSKRADERRLVIAGLAEMTTPAALGLLGPMLDDPALQSEAAVAAIKLARASAAANRAQARAFVQKVLSFTKDPELQKEARGLLARLK